MAGYSKSHSGVKRIMTELRELERDASPDYTAKPIEEDLFDWHCTLRGPPDSEFEGGKFHCRIVLPPEYPFKAPSIMLLTPNGRFELNKKICLNFTSYHEDLWQPSWGVRTAIIGLQSFFPVKGEAAMGVGGMDVPVSERKRLAALSGDWICPHCKQPNSELLPDPPADISSTKEESSPVPSKDASLNDVVPTSTTPGIILSNAPIELNHTSIVSLTPPQKLDPVVIPSSPSAQPPSAPAPALALNRTPSSRPIDLTPSTPAARILPTPATPIATNSNYNNNSNNHGGVDIDHLQPQTLTATEPLIHKRETPLVLDAAIGMLAVLLAALVVRRFV